MIDRGALQHQLLELVRNLPRVQVQNRLMACTDRDVALALVGLTDVERESVLATVSVRKAARIREEVALQERRRVDPKHAVFALGVVIGSLESEGLVKGNRSYLRPHRRDRGDGRRR